MRKAAHAFAITLAILLLFDTMRARAEPVGSMPAQVSNQ